MNSPLFHLIHLPKSAGNSIWRELIKSTENYSDNPNHVIKLDTRNFVDDKYWNNLYFMNSEDYKNNTTYLPQNSLSILAHKEVNKLLVQFKLNHKILVHHHNSGAFRLPLSKFNNAYYSKQTSSHKWKFDENPQIYVFTLRDSLERSISQIKFAFMVNSVFQTPTTDKSANYKNGPYWIGGLDADALPYDRRPAIEMLAIEYMNNKENLSEYVEFALQIIPEFATYQLRYLLTFIFSKNPTETYEILWIKTNQEIINLWKSCCSSLKKSAKKHEIGAIYLDKFKKFHFSTPVKQFMTNKLNIEEFEIKNIFQETKTNSQICRIKPDEEFCFYSDKENLLLNNAFDFQ